MRAVMSQLVDERTQLGDREPVLVSSFYIPGVLWRRQGLSPSGRLSDIWSLLKNVSDELQILKLRGELLELGSTVRQLKQAGLDGAAAQLLLSRKRAELEDAIARKKNAVRTSQVVRPQGRQSTVD
jgi:hypothetical protein